MKFEELYNSLAMELIHNGETVDVGEWHAQDVSDQPMLVTRELGNIVIQYPVPHFLTSLQERVQPNMPFAEAQFQDRVSGLPSNPPPSADLWPYKHKDHEEHLLKAGGHFSHTYPERFWPKRAGSEELRELPREGFSRFGIRYPYGDLNDVVTMLAKSPFTRQAYLPVWFPEDTGNQGVRLPCSLGYHFMLRKGKLNMTYFIRSVDFVRHFRDDFYMAARLLQWVLQQLQPSPAFADNNEQSQWVTVAPGTLTMHMISLHCMEGDLPMMRRNLAKDQ